MTHEPLRAPRTKAEIAAQLYWLSDHMLDIATSIKHYCDDDSWADKSVEMMGASAIAREWADEMGVG
ncbi:MAG: hypothetical protein UW55_C0024G0002 [Candidatus Giovannonibacteria bacterium GW2011_GWA2_44_26]|uniref:Uncharacterized protein n=1 Tax=Candidatus Giovannonibacteria bacterium GW2011_GWA2_44_26 TaxID=1618648 RepID=A0A0G1IRJ7_9BACT|nr:MAG: hypothetical protein UW55_C0024G0002 [Candidatus Giovannonibacteria bacterium GW2011_GWA2_44_26]